MISKNLYYQLIFRVMILVIVAVSLGICLAKNGPYSLIALLLFVEVVVTINLVRYLNTTNRKMSFFLESVENDDSTLLFNSRESNQAISELYKNLNKVNSQIQQVKIESRQQEQYFQALLEQVATGIITFNAKGFVLHANHAVKKMLGIHVLTHINQLERVHAGLFQIVKSINPFEHRLISFNNENGPVQLSLKATSFRTNENELILVSFQDIRHELDEKEHDSWMKLIKVLMHEMMNSIAPITSLSETLCSFYTLNGRLLLPEEIRESTIQTTYKGLNVIREQGDGLMRFVDSYRKLSGLPQPVRKIFSVDELFNRMKILFGTLEHRKGHHPAYRRNELRSST